MDFGDRAVDNATDEIEGAGFIVAGGLVLIVRNRPARAVTPRIPAVGGRPRDLGDPGIGFEGDEYVTLPSSCFLSFWLGQRSAWRADRWPLLVASSSIAAGVFGCFDWQAFGDDLR